MPKRLVDVLDEFERLGKLNVRGEELQTALPETSAEGIRKARYRLQQAGRLVPISRGSEHWLIVPLQYATAGSPPLEAWLDSYLRKTLQVPYYVGLLSAAEIYGASPYAVMVTQVMVEHRRRTVIVGRHELVFHTRIRIEAMPTRWHQTAEGRFRVSTPELTVLDLIQRESLVGGMGRVQEVLRGLWSQCSPEGFTAALDALQHLPLGQRLGALLERDQQTALTAPVTHWLKGKPVRTVSLEGSLPAVDQPAGTINTNFKVWIPDTLEGANT